MRKAKRAALTMIATMVLAGCSNSAEVTTPLSSRVKADVLQTYAGSKGASDIKVLAMWRADAIPEGQIICGELEAPAELKAHRQSLRFLDDRSNGYAQVEFHELWAGSPMATRIVDTNKALFNQTWDQHCKPFSPLKPWWKFWS
jgi:hypothetical protein